MKLIIRGKLAIFAVAFAFVLPAHAWTDAELSMLPQYCAARVRDNNPQAAQQWIAQFGRENWVHIHHYCGGLNALNKYYGQNAYERGRSLSGAVWEFDYVLKHTQPGFYLRADFHYNRGRALRLQGKDGAALGDLVKALELSPGMPPASIELAGLYKKLGKKDKALTTLKTALARSPTNKGLRRAYLEMGGDLASIPTTPAPVPETKDAPKEPDSIAEPAQVEASPAVAQSKPEVIEQKIGNETNPWCRFCPDPAETKIEKQ